jgi:hypothetical protein
MHYMYPLTCTFLIICISWKKLMYKLLLSQWIKANILKLPQVNTPDKYYNRLKILPVKLYKRQETMNFMSATSIFHALCIWIWSLFCCCTDFWTHHFVLTMMQALYHLSNDFSHFNLVILEIGSCFLPRLTGLQSTYLSFCCHWDDRYTPICPAFFINVRSCRLIWLS